jgi:hypothetical protein
VLDVVELGTVVATPVDEVNARVVDVRLIVEVVVGAEEELVELAVVEVEPVAVLLVVLPVVEVVAPCDQAEWARARVRRMTTAAPVAASTPTLRMATVCPRQG